MSSASKFLSKEEQKSIVEAIKAAELDTSGEIRVHIESRCSGNALDRAVYIFNKLKMFDTAQRNGVLIYVAYDSHKFAIIGDSGINETVPEDFWTGIRGRMSEAFGKGAYVAGIIEAVNEVGTDLKQYFPYKEDDVNEQPDEISFG